MNGVMKFGAVVVMAMSAASASAQSKTITPTTITGSTSTVCPNSCTTSAAYFPLIFGVRF